MKTTETTQTTGHTPGPWKAYFYGTDSYGYVICNISADDGNERICEHTKCKDRPKAEANARLIAAAPELLNMLERMTAEGTFGQPCLLTLEHARNAIAKANGNP